MNNRAQKWNVGPERRKGLGTSRADVSGNARHFCDCELNYTGYEGERSGLNHWTETTEGTYNVLRTFREVDVSPVSPSSTTQNVSLNSPLRQGNRRI